MRVNETDNDQFICANIQKRIKSRTWSAQFSQFNTFFWTSRRQNARKVLLIYVPLVRAVTGTSIRPTKNGIFGWWHPKRRKSSYIMRNITCLFHQLLHIIIKFLRILKNRKLRIASSIWYRFIVTSSFQSIYDHFAFVTSTVWPNTKIIITETFNYLLPCKRNFHRPTDRVSSKGSQFTRRSTSMPWINSTINSDSGIHKICTQVKIILR